MQDRPLLGPRFCAGGYVWQVATAEGTPLLSGPEGPAPSPDPFNGHGLPESFRDRARDGRPLTWHGDRGLAPGAGILSRDTTGAIVIAEPCAWTITGDHAHRRFTTAHALGEQAYALTQLIAVDERRLTSTTEFTNTGPAPLQLQWFAHPFFPLGPDGTLTATLPAGTRLPTNPGFTLDSAESATLRFQRRFVGVDDGQFELLTLPPEHILECTLTHPALPGGVRFATSFVPSECPVWANGYTFSIEPYQVLDLAPGETRRWTLTYDFDGPLRVR